MAQAPLAGVSGAGAAQASAVVEPAATAGCAEISTSSPHSAAVDARYNSAAVICMGSQRHRMYNQIESSRAEEAAAEIRGARSPAALVKTAASPRARVIIIMSMVCWVTEVCVGAGSDLSGGSSCSSSCALCSLCSMAPALAPSHQPSRSQGAPGGAYSPHPNHCHAAPMGRTHPVQCPEHMRQRQRSENLQTRDSVSTADNIIYLGYSTVTNLNFMSFTVELEICLNLVGCEFLELWGKTQNSIFERSCPLVLFT